MDNWLYLKWAAEFAVRWELEHVVFSFTRIKQTELVDWTL